MAITAFSSTQVNTPNIAVIQTGARRAYTVASMIQEIGCLHSLHTTIAFRNTVPAPIAKRLLSRLLPWKRAALERRTAFNLEPEKVYSYWLPELSRQAVKQFTVGNMTPKKSQNLILGTRINYNSIDGADTIFSVDGSGGKRFLKKMKDAGRRILLDVAIDPRALDLVRDANQIWSEWPIPRPSIAEVERFRLWYDELVEIADLVLYPSENVLAGLRTLKNFDVSRSVHLPYPLSAITPIPQKTEPGRIFFAGSGAIRKGLPALAQAAAEMSQTNPEITFHVAGQFEEGIAPSLHTEHIDFLGHISKSEMAKQMSRADVFCLPSIAEGTAAVTLEALATGIPCVVTRESGAPILDGENGILISPNSPKEIISAIKKIVYDRTRRQRMSENALRLSSHFSQRKVRERLQDILLDVSSSIQSSDDAITPESSIPPRSQRNISDYTRH